ncbi:hypothetical protein BDB00DRAFT_551685 [Zychaea mexicana]|uniref:uncharacterized protein n=1 Tax=Zychaea mexicana TaxID=64656 RepID=UPI0022FF2284|nr:uncharacterized protein BDB00DRAFT_551685 [Zychaea mexicana]KAI9490498.1 hypothetical protein BDB00DRAFT_551685 [Zychaea mexicana]
MYTRRLPARVSFNVLIKEFMLTKQPIRRCRIYQEARTRSIRRTSRRSCGRCYGDKQPTSSAPKKSKRDGEEEDIEPSSATSVRTIRRNLKDMSTADKESNNPESTTSLQPNEQEEDTTMHHNEEKNKEDEEIQEASSETIKEAAVDTTTMTNNGSSPLLHDQQAEQQEQEKESASEKKKHAFAAFGGGNEDDDGWGEFAEVDKDEQAKKDSAAAAEERPKYTFGATSGFGTKGWSSQQTATPPVAQTTQKPTFGGFSGFGAFGSRSGTNSSTTATTTTPLVPTASSSNKPVTFGSFAQASSFALAAASSPTNALQSVSVLNKDLSYLSNASTTTDNEDDGESNNTETRSATLTPEPAADNTTSTTTNPIKPVKQAEVFTGEEDEDTLYQTKAKLYEMEGTTGNWKERGVGTLRIKQHKENSERRRVVMRADSVYRLILNIRLVSWLKFEIMQERFVRFGAIEMETNENGTAERKFRSFALKVANPTAADDLLNNLVSSLPNEDEKAKD